MRRLAGWVGALLVSFSPVMANEAYDPFAPWHKVCFDARLPEKADEQKEGQKTPARDNSKHPICYTYTYIWLSDVAVGVVGVLEVQVRKKRLIVAQFVDYLSLEAAYIQINGNPPIDLIHATCDQGFCYAKAEIGADVVEQLTTAYGLWFHTRSPQWKNLTVPLEYRGFAEAYANAPAQDGSAPNLKAMQEAVVRMLAE